MTIMLFSHFAHSPILSPFEAVCFLLDIVCDGIFHFSDSGDPIRVNDGMMLGLNFKMRERKPILLLNNFHIFSDGFV